MWNLFWAYSITNGTERRITRTVHTLLAQDSNRGREICQVRFCDGWWPPMWTSCSRQPHGVSTREHMLEHKAIVSSVRSSFVLSFFFFFFWRCSSRAPFGLNRLNSACLFDAGWEWTFVSMIIWRLWLPLQWRLCSQRCVLGTDAERDGDLTKPFHTSKWSYVITTLHNRYCVSHPLTVFVTFVLWHFCNGQVDFVKLFTILPSLPPAIWYGWTIQAAPSSQQ